MNRKWRLSSKNSPSPSSSLKKSNKADGSKASTSTPSKTPTKQLTMEEILERQKEKQRLSCGRSTPKVLFDSESSNSPGKVTPASVNDNKPDIEPFKRTNKLSLSRKKQISNTNSTTSSTTMDKGTHLYGERVNINKKVGGFFDNNEEALDVEECWSSLKSMETKPTNFRTPSKEPPAQRDVTPSSVSRRRTPSTPSSTTKLNKGIPFMHKKVLTPPPAVAASSVSRDLKQTALASPTSFIKTFNAFTTPTKANTLSSDKKAKSRTKLLMGDSNFNVQYPKQNSEKAATRNPRIPKKSLSIFDDSDEESSDSGIHLENRSVGFSPSKSTCSVSCASTFTDVLSEEVSCSSVDASRPGCFAPQQACTPSSSAHHDEKGEKRSNASVTLDDTPTSSKRLKLSLKSRRSHIPSTSTSEKCLSDVKIKMEPAGDSDVIVTNKSSPQPLSHVPTCASSLNVIALNVDLNLVKSEIPSIEPQKQQRQNRFINKIPKCFADLKDCFKPLSPQNRKPRSSSLLELPELIKQLGLELPRNSVGIKHDENPSTVDPDSESPQLAYYWSNFLEIARSVLDIPDDRRLFNDNEIGTIRKYYTLSEDAQMLYSRLFVRHHKWHPSATINYPEIADNLRPILKELISVDYIEGDESLKNLETALGLLQVAQIKQLCKDCNVKCEATKVQCVRAILDNCSKHKPLFNGMGAEQERHSVILKRAKEKLRDCYRVTDKPRNIFRRMMMLYSLSDTYWDSGQKENQPVQLTNLMHVNFGKLIYPSYEMERKATIFRDRDDLLRYEIAFTLEIDIWSSMEAKKWSEAKLLCDNALVMYQNLIKDHSTVHHELQLPDFLREYTPGYLLTRCLNYRVEVLQKLRCYEEANLQLKELLNQKSHCQHYRGYWIDRYALNAHQHLKLPLEALKIIEDGHKDPLVTEDHLLSLSARAERLRSSKQIDPALFENLKLFKISKAPEVEMNGQKLDKTPLGNRSFFYYDKYNVDTSEMEAQACSVEDFALQKYNEQGYPNGIHAEGSILISLFGLIFWDIIYAPGIPDAFRSPHQAFPLDLHSESFFNNRKTQLDRRLDFIKLSPLEEVTAIIDQHWKENEGRASIVSWNLLSCDDAMSLVGCIGSSCLHNICERLLRNLRHFRSGVPDLTVWNPTTKMWKMVEVKGPGDRLSNKQRVWLHFLMSIGAPVEVCYVQAVGGKMIANAGGISLEEC